MVNNQVMRDSFCPKNEFAFFVVALFFQRDDYFHKCILEDIIGEIVIKQFVINKRKEFFLVPLYQEVQEFSSPFWYCEISRLSDLLFITITYLHVSLQPWCCSFMIRSVFLISNYIIDNQLFRNCKYI